MSNETVSFGKYKGQPMSKLLEDQSYFKWCKQQEWFQEKFASLCDENECTPEPAHTYIPHERTPAASSVRTPAASSVRTPSASSVRTPAASTSTSSAHVQPDDIEEKIMQLESDNRILMNKIESNKMEIRRLKQGTSGVSEPRTVVKNITGKCLL